MREHEEIQEKLIEVANRRYATKKFDPDRKVDDDDWRTILEVGRLSPSSFGYERGSSLSLIIRRCVKTLSQSPGEPSTASMALTSCS
ncbi:MAG: nitroreductase family protein [Limosilactobacillus mucosae]|nr:nitroreductase family protein [Limosilactobacillus mucosae]MDY5413089.1 nitroreductase family protein [Limosilactobacillus mucosae]